MNLPHARHSFTNPDAHKAGMAALAYNAEADQASWDKMLKLFAEVFGQAEAARLGAPSAR